MKLLPSLLAMCAALATSIPAARAADAPPPAAPGVPNVVSPEVSADRVITFRYFAPHAQNVSVRGEIDGQVHAMTKDAAGVWTAKVGPLAPDIYTYTFLADGVALLDPRNANTKYGYGMWGPVSIVQVPGDGPQFYDVKPVPHGEVRIVPYVSKTLGVSRTAWVYTPPGYERGRNFPVVYLLHGAGDIESGWTMIGRAPNILDNLIAEKKAVPMVLVMPLGHEVQSFWAGPAREAEGAATLATLLNPPLPTPLSKFGQDLVEDVIPLIESRYKVSKSPDRRAIVGLSMGGAQTLNLAFNRPELFRSVALMSPAAFGNAELMYPSAFRDPAALNKQFKLFWIRSGRDDAIVLQGLQALDASLQKAGIKHDYALTEGRHEWTVWRQYLRDLAPLLFR